MDKIEQFTHCRQACEYICYLYAWCINVTIVSSYCKETWVSVAWSKLGDIITESETHVEICRIFWVSFGACMVGTYRVGFDTCAQSCQHISEEYGARPKLSAIISLLPFMWFWFATSFPRHLHARSRTSPSSLQLLSRPQFLQPWLVLILKHYTVSKPRRQ